MERYCQGLTATAAPKQSPGLWDSWNGAALGASIAHSAGEGAALPARKEGQQWQDWQVSVEDRT